MLASILFSWILEMAFGNDCVLRTAGREMAAEKKKKIVDFGKTFLERGKGIEISLITG